MDQLRSEQLGYGIVCDEFGVTRGIVTLKDIFEALVGEIPEDLDEPDIVRREDGAVWWTGSVPSTIFWPTSTWRRSFRTPLTKRSAG